MSRLTSIVFAVMLLSGCAKKTPQGRYTARVDAGSMFVQMSYDFRENHAATFWITTNGAAVAAQGQWKTDKERVLFDGNTTDPVTQEIKRVSHILHFDGDDLFRDDLTVRFVHEK
ncbi:MAG: hypothetical protein QM760_09670 [Nibricoccus sp.]